MRKSILSLILSISVTLAPCTSAAQTIDPLGSFYIYLPVILAFLAASQSKGSITPRPLNKIRLLEKLDDGATVIKPDDAATILRKGSRASDHDRLVVANSAMANVISNGFWVSRTFAFSGLSVYTFTPANHEIERKLTQVFEKNAVTPNPRQRNLLDLFANVVEFELMVRALGVKPDPIRTNILAGYFLALSASTAKLEDTMRETIAEEMAGYLAKKSPSLVGDIASVIQDEGRAVSLNRSYRKLNLRSLQFMPPWMVGVFGGTLSGIASIVALMISDVNVVQMLEPLRSMGIDPYAASFFGPMLAIPVATGVTSSAAYKILLGRFLKPKLDQAAREVALSACQKNLLPEGAGD